jgi:hypothetical protein
MLFVKGWKPWKRKNSPTTHFRTLADAWPAPKFLFSLETAEALGAHGLRYLVFLKRNEGPSKQLQDLKFANKLILNEVKNLPSLVGSWLSLMAAGVPVLMMLIVVSAFIRKKIDNASCFF